MCPHQDSLRRGGNSVSLRALPGSTSLSEGCLSIENGPLAHARAPLGTGAECGGGQEGPVAGPDPMKGYVGYMSHHTGTLTDESRKCSADKVAFTSHY